MSIPSSPSRPPLPRRAFLMRWFARAVVAALLAADAAALLALLADRWWAFDVVANFAVQLCLALLAGILFCLWQRRWLPALVSLPVLLVTLWPIAGYYLPVQPAQAATGPATLRVMTLNLWGRNDRIDLVEALVKAEQPDVIALSEVTPAWRTRLAALQADYPFQHQAAPWTGSDLLLLSRLPLTDLAVARLGVGKRSTLLATVCPPAAGGRCLDIVTVHLERPEGRVLARVRDTHLHEMARIVRASADRTVVLGDFNMTPWSPYFRQFLSDAGLADSARGRGVAPTWFSRWLPFGLPIDQVLVGPAIAVAERHVGADVGSDHLPVIADLNF